MKQDSRTKYRQEIFSAIFYGKAPESAIGWDLVEAVQTTVLRGGGESTSWHPHLTIRVNGKQVWRGTPYDADYEKPLEQLGELLPIGAGRNSKLYLRKPAQQTS